MRKPLARFLRAVALTASDLAEALEPQPPAKQPGAFTVHSGTGTTTFEPRLTWHQTEV